MYFYIWWPVCLMFFHHHSLCIHCTIIHYPLWHIFGFSFFVNYFKAELDFHPHCFLGFFHHSSFVVLTRTIFNLHWFSLPTHSLIPHTLNSLKKEILMHSSDTVETKKIFWKDKWAQTSSTHSPLIERPFLFLIRAPRCSIHPFLVILLYT